MKLGKHATDFLSQYSTRAIAIGFGLVVALMLALLVFTLHRINNIGTTFNEIVAEHNHHAALAYKMRATARDRTSLLLEITYDTDAFSQDEKVQRFHELGVQFGEARKALLSYHLIPEEVALLERQNEFTQSAIHLQEQVIELALSGQQKDAVKLLVGSAMPAQERVLKVLNQFFQHQTEEVQEVVNTAARLQRQTFFYILFGGITALLLAVLIGVAVSQLMSALLAKLGGTTSELEQSLNELEFQKQALDEHAIVSITDAQGRITYVNDKFCQVSQYTTEELLGQDHRLLNSDYHSKMFFAGMWHTITSGKVWQGEVRNRKKDGSFYWVETTIVPFLDEAGKPYQYVSIRTEVTRTKEAEQVLNRGKEDLENLVHERTDELRGQEEVLRLITSAAHDAIVMIDDSGALTFWNEAADKTFGYTSDEVMGRNFFEIVIPPQLRHEEQYETGLKQIAAVKSENTGAGVEMEIMRKDGSECFIEFSISAVQIRGQWHGIGIARDITDRRLAEEKLKLQATTDALTGIPNRRLFDSRLETEMSRVARYHFPLSIMIMDIDHFKRVNDTFGHQVGDDVLVELTRLVSEQIRSDDIFARWGGEEFVILSPGIDAENMRLVAEKLRVAVESHVFPVISFMTCSFGLATHSASDTAESFIGRADTGLYRAKENGRNRVEMA